jgi:hypothetical protein
VDKKTQKPRADQWSQNAAREGAQGDNGPQAAHLLPADADFLAVNQKSLHPAFEPAAPLVHPRSYGGRGFLMRG